MQLIRWENRLWWKQRFNNLRVAATNFVEVFLHIWNSLEANIHELKAFSLQFYIINSCIDKCFHAQSSLECWKWNSRAAWEKWQLLSLFVADIKLIDLLIRIDSDPEKKLSAMTLNGLFVNCRNVMLSELENQLIWCRQNNENQSLRPMKAIKVETLTDCLGWRFFFQPMMMRLKVRQNLFKVFFTCSSHSRIINLHAFSHA